MTLLMKKHRGLGRGLDSFFRESFVSDDFSTSDSVIQCSVEELFPGKCQPRTFTDPDVLEELSASIRAHGVIQPIVVRPRAGGGYEIIAGDRRWRASKLAGLKLVPVIVRDVPDSVALPLAIIENVQREALTPIDEAQAIKRLLDEFGMTHQQVSETIGRSRTAVTNLLRLLSLHKGVVQLLQDSCIDVGHARPLLSLSKEDQIEAAKQIIDRGLSVRQTEAMVRSFVKQPGRSDLKKNPNRIDADTRLIQERLSDILCAPVSINKLSNGSFCLSVKYDTLDQLDGFLSRFGVFETDKVMDIC